MGIEADGDFDNGFGGAFRELPLADGALCGVREDSVAAENFNVLNRAVGFDSDFHADGAADAPTLQDRGILRFHLLDNSSLEFLGVGERRTRESEESTTKKTARNFATANSAHFATFKPSFLRVGLERRASLLLPLVAKDSCRRGTRSGFVSIKDAKNARHRAQPCMSLQLKYVTGAGDVDGAELGGRSIGDFAVFVSRKRFRLRKITSRDDEVRDRDWGIRWARKG